MAKVLAQEGEAKELILRVREMRAASELEVATESYASMLEQVQTEHARAGGCLDESDTEQDETARGCVYDMGVQTMGGCDAGADEADELDVKEETQKLIAHTTLNEVSVKKQLLKEQTQVTAARLAVAEAEEAQANEHILRERELRAFSQRVEAAKALESTQRAFEALSTVVERRDRAGWYRTETFVELYEGRDMLSQVLAPGGRPNRALIRPASDAIYLPNAPR
jgi:hypothetical protein